MSERRASNDGPIGFSAEIKGVDTGAAALDALRAALPEHAEIKGFDDDRISYVTVYFNGDAISVRDIDESETDDGEGCCEYCGRSEDEPGPSRLLQAACSAAVIVLHSLQRPG